MEVHVTRHTIYCVLCLQDVFSEYCFNDFVIVFLYSILSASLPPKLWRCAHLYLLRVAGAGAEHDQHVVESLQLDVVPQQPPEEADGLVELLLVQVRHGPGGGELLLVLQAQSPHPLQSLKVSGLLFIINGKNLVFHRKENFLERKKLFH